jgi:hypothetical protein
VTTSEQMAVELCAAQLPGQHPYVESRVLHKHLGSKERGGWQHSKRPLLDRLMSRVVFGLSDCWHFCGTRNQGGYGRLTVGGRMQVVHRLSYELFVGPIADGLFVLHSCDNPSCINPAHLSLGTRSDNARDCFRKGRHPLAVWAQSRKVSV